MTKPEPPPSAADCARLIDRLIVIAAATALCIFGLAWWVRP